MDDIFFSSLEASVIISWFVFFILGTWDSVEFFWLTFGLEGTDMAGEPGGGVASELDRLRRSFSSSILANKRSMFEVKEFVVGLGFCCCSDGGLGVPRAWRSEEEQGGDAFGERVRNEFMLAKFSVVDFAGKEDGDNRLAVPLATMVPLVTLVPLVPLVLVPFTVDLVGGECFGEEVKNIASAEDSFLRGGVSGPPTGTLLLLLLSIVFP